MGIVAKSSGQDFENELLPAGTHTAVCYAMIDLGTQDTEFNGVKSKKRQVRIVWELTDERKVFDEARGEEPLSAGKNFTLSMHEKAGLRKFIENWRGTKYSDSEAEAVEITVLLGVPCLLSIAHGKNETTGKEYAQINSASKLIKGMAKPAQHNPSYFFSLDDYDQYRFDKLPRQRILIQPFLFFFCGNPGGFSFLAESEYLIKSFLVGMVFYRKCFKFNFQLINLSLHAGDNRQLIFYG